MDEDSANTFFQPYLLDGFNYHAWIQSVQLNFDNFFQLMRGGEKIPITTKSRPSLAHQQNPI